MLPITTPHTFTLTNAEREALRERGSTVPYPTHGAIEPFVFAARAAVTATAPERLLVHLDVMRNGVVPPGLTVIENVPFDSGVVRGLADPEQAESGKPTDLSETVLTGMVAMFAEPYGVLQEGRGLVSNLSPKKDRLKSNTGLGALIELGLHVENAIGRCLPGDRSPDGLALIGVAKELRSSPGTMVADSRLALARLPAAIVAVLRDPTAYLVKAPERWRSGPPVEKQTAIVRGDLKAPVIVAAFYGDMVTARTKAATEALAAFKDALAEVAIDVAIEPGMMVMFDNTFMLHGRRDFTPSFDEAGLPYRWVQRIFWTSSMRRFGEWERTRGRLVTARV